MRRITTIWLGATFLASSLLVLPGCTSSRLTGSVLDDIRRENPTNETLVLQSGKWSDTESPKPGTAQADLRLAESVFQKGEYARAAKAFDEVISKHSDKPAIDEKAMFMKAESDFYQMRFTRARDGYEELLKKYPGGAFSDESTQRLFAIADIWLEDARADVREGRPASWRRFVNWTPGKPVFDIDGHADRLLGRVREVEPNGALADESLMMSAGYHFARGNYDEAGQLYEQLMRGYPKSKHQAEAHVMSADAKLKSYKGAPYDSKRLEDSKKILQASLRQFPEELRPQRQKVYHKLQAIEDEYARREFEIGEYYRRVGPLVSAKYYYELVVRKYADTKWATRAAERLDELSQSPEPPKESKRGFSLWPWSRGEKTEE